MTTTKAKGKRKAEHIDEIDTASNESANGVPAAGAERSESPEAATPAKKAKNRKKAVTERCPVCEEDIPLRLLALHLDLEMTRVEEIIGSIGKNDIDPSLLPPLEDEPSASTPRRPAALRARKSLNASSSASHRELPTSSSSRTNPVISRPHIPQTPTDIQAVQAIRDAIRNRKARLAKFRELGKELDDEPENANGSGSTTASTICPVCSQNVGTGGELARMEAHIDECIVEQGRIERMRLEAESGLMEYEIDGQARVRVTDLAGFRGTGFDVRDREQMDVDDDVDIEAGDEDVYGNTQFTENDIIRSPDEEYIDVGQESVLRSSFASASGDASDSGLKKKGKENGVTMNGLGQVFPHDKAIQEARGAGDMPGLVLALERKIAHLISSSAASTTAPVAGASETTEGGTSLQISGSANGCRICLDAYKDPTVSTGCWHTCCSDCWLRCLGSTKLCPICKRITGASELRRIYL